MMPLWTISMASFALGYAGLSGLCLAMTRHHQQVWQRRGSVVRVRVLRAVGVLLLGLSLITAVLGWGAGIGVVLWFGVISGATVLIVLSLAYAPRIVTPAAVAAGVIGLLALATKMQS